jgi:hypothetical protein
MGTRKTYALFTISQENKIDEIYDCGKYNETEKRTISVSKSQL